MSHTTGLMGLLAVLLAGAQASPPGSDATGSICVAPVKDDGDPRGYFSEKFAVRIDKGAWIAVPADAPHLIPDLALDAKHLVSIRDGQKIIESFWFRFDEFESRDLCLWYKSWYRTWSLWNVADGGRKCRCERPHAPSPARAR